MIAEKLEALVILGITNSRMKDFFDLWTIACQANLDGTILRDAVVATFTRRETPMPSSTPIGLTDIFSRDAHKMQQWRGFISKNALDEVPLVDVVDVICTFLVPVIESAYRGTPFNNGWQPGSGWTRR